MAAPRTHFIGETINGIALALCRVMSGRITDDEAKTDCRLCLAELKAAEPASRSWTPVLLGPGAEPDDCTDAPRWRSWQAAVRAYVRFEDEGQHLGEATLGRVVHDAKGNGGLMPGGPRGSAPGGDKGQRAVGKVAFVGAAIEAALEGSLHLGGEPVPREVARAVLWASVAGRRVELHPEAKLEAHPNREFGGVMREKAVYTDREEWSHEDIARELSKQLGREITDVHVRGLVNDRGRIIERELVRRGLVPQRDLEVEVAANILVGWKEIAEHCRMSERTAQKAQRWQPPIPIRWRGGRVQADPDELTRWLADSPRLLTAEEG